ncbi:MAG TPA: hypothetical protein DIT64_04810 [Verrucomicrobiales bacterium]|nr:hypothetical protein [Verrucomicrobiales bacterium]
MFSIHPAGASCAASRFAGCVLSCLAASVLQAQTGLKIELVPETTAIVPGEAFRAGILIQPEPGWHTYWRQPGIVGVPTRMAWELPEGFSAGELEYPGPEAVLMFHIKAQGFKRDVLLQTRITAPGHLKPGETVTLRGRASWMCCGNTCHPGTQILELKMPVACGAEPHVRWAPVFERERETFERESSLWEVEAEENGMTVTVKLRPAGAGARLFAGEAGTEGLRFFTEDGWINSDEEQAFTLTDDGALKVGLTRAEVFLGGGGPPERLHGVLRREGGWEKGQSWPCLRIASKITRRDALKDLQTRR